ncbi:hypothetical protein MARLIPOL_06994 [Marinobacter lipolyticus SM19]|uniref:Uncharacterized protein n=1 Tax=Marinobacter lipolyticus SM19 TaxID=1318628 RepID=R8B1L6_9GAMM|nr:hypothetical protein [Marinobacter lipolyticus]EON92478.1 hypothetical protein MARLIPOL_06994 [Marinobacter lipolyticus SM19]
MHTFLVILGGFVLLALAVAVARTAGRTFSAALPFYLLVWFVFAALNMGVGVYHAGYSFMDELPIFILVFGLPAATAAILARKF